ncbi:hypothetical protein [uncultured Nostoc sp.]|uniref:hypothetical protein n=1 Tax=uncultured Nostoc sp. TaxID=340711 RepID=UPI0035CAE052
MSKKSLPAYTTLGLTQLRNNVDDAKRLAAGYHRGTEKPVRPCGSPTCTPTGILLRS